MVFEEREDDLLAVELAGLAVEVDHPHLLAGVAGRAPLPVVPGAHDEGVGGAGGRLLDRLVAFQGAEEVLGVEPAAHRQHGGFDIIEVRPDVAGLPPGVVGPVLHQLVPEGDAALEVLRVGVGERPHPEEEVVAVGGLVVEAGDGPLGGRLGAGSAEVGQEVEGVREPEDAVAVEVVADEPVGDGGLRRRRLERGVGAHQAARGVEPGVGDPPLADPAVVVGDVLRQPLDRVVGVGRLVDPGGVGAGPGRAHVDELPLRHVSAADVLVGEDVAGLAEL